MFDRHVEIQLFVTKERDVSELSVAIVNDFLNLDWTSFKKIKHFLWWGCRDCCENSDYGFAVKKGKNITETNHEVFDVFNEEDAY